MKQRAMLGAVVAAATLAALVACGVPKADYEKVTKELQQANQDKTALTDQVAKDKEQVSQLQGQVASLMKENGDLKAKLAPKKPAAKPAKTAAKPAAKTTATKKK